MKINLSELKNHLARHLSPSYVISGDEVFLKQDALRLIRKTAEKAGYNERSRFVIETGFDWNQFYTILFSTSLFSEKRLIELDARHASPGKAGGEVLLAYAQSPATDTILLVDMEKVDAKTAKIAWYQALDKIGITLPVWPISREQLPQWIMLRGKTYKLHIRQDAASLLADYVEGNLAAAAQAIEKIYLMQCSKEIDISMLESILTDESQFTIFDFIDALFAGKQGKALRMLEQFQAEGMEATLILWGISRELRLLSEMAKELKRGTPYDIIFKQHRIFSKRQAMLRSFLNKKTVEDCLHLLAHATDIDRIIKGALSGNVWDHFRLFCLRLS